MSVQVHMYVHACVNEWVCEYARSGPADYLLVAGPSLGRAAR